MYGAVVTFRSSLMSRESEGIGTVRMGCIPNGGTWPGRVVLLLLVGRRGWKPALPLVSGV